MAKLQAELDADRKVLDGLMVDAQLDAAIAKAKGRGALLKSVLRSLIQARRNDDGSRTVVVLDDKGQPRIADAQGNPFTISALVAERKQDPQIAGAFDGSGASGGGPPARRASRRAAAASVRRPISGPTPTRRRTRASTASTSTASCPTSSAERPRRRASRSVHRRSTRPHPRPIARPHHPAPARLGRRATGVRLSRHSSHPVEPKAHCRSADRHVFEDFAP